MSSVDRRQFVGAMGVGAASLLAAGGAVFGQAVEAPREAAQHQVKPLQYAADSVAGISREVISWHHGTHYAGYVSKRNAIEGQLAKLGPGTEGFDSRVYAGIKRDEAFNASGMILHEVYFDNLGGDGVPGEDIIEAGITAFFGSLERWEADTRAVAGAATGWALLCHDPSDGRLHNYLVDQHQLGAIWGAAPIVALDVFEHAYYRDFGPDRAAYLDVFFKNLHWGRIDRRYREALGLPTG